jgi:ferritin-like metal-binding protein YciE
MDDLLLHGLKDIYYAENQISKSLPKLIEKATNRDLTKGLRDHLEETRNQVARLDQVFKKLGQEPKGVQCPAVSLVATPVSSSFSRSTPWCWSARKSKNSSWRRMS